MTDRDEDRLSSGQRAALADWAEASVPDGFADRVMDAWAQESLEAAIPTATRRGFAWRRRHTVMTLAAAAAALLMVLRAAPPAASTAPAGGEARRVLLANCAPCHDGTAPAAEPDALAVFDLRRTDWWTGLSQAQLRTLLDRSEAMSMPESDRAVVARFVAQRHRG
jgi:hypothetical protein